MVLIKSLEDFELFKEFLIKPICYVYYKGSLALNATYVGFTAQHGYKYLKRHHKMKKIEDVLNQGYFIQIYTKYNENSLIKLFKPTLNQVAGSGICGRVMGSGNLRSVGEICMKKYGSNKNKSIETNNYVIKIPMDLIFTILEKEKQKYEPNCILQTFYQNEYIQLMCTKDRKIDPSFECLFQILQYCKIHCLYLSYTIIHEVYLENLLHHVQQYPLWIDLFKHSDNYKKIHCDIVSRLKDNHYLTNSILDYKNQSFELNKGPSYYYRLALSNVINECNILIYENHPNTI
jgi:hypothetical protein